jgi:DNA-binding response OmpR family regulator
VAIVSTDTPQLALVDWQMPEMDGLETCCAIHRSSDIPVIMVTSRNQSDREKALAAGAVDYVTKPFDFDHLMTRVESALSR